ncbi:hypothetical protein FACS1894141_1950 [Spirochaetia bacterium]|nr:hypothetical protein FACS1894141_1950 [Spirochaetia bacterium]
MPFSRLASLLLITFELINAITSAIMQNKKTLKRTEALIKKVLLSMTVFGI